MVGQTAELTHDRLRASRISRNHQNRVVAGNGADNLRQARPIEGQSQELRLSRARSQHDQLLHRHRAGEIFGQAREQAR